MNQLEWKCENAPVLAGSGKTCGFLVRECGLDLPFLWFPDPRPPHEDLLLFTFTCFGLFKDDDEHQAKCVNQLRRSVCVGALCEIAQVHQGVTPALLSRALLCVLEGRCIFPVFECFAFWLMIC